MTRDKILWVDDDINISLSPFVDELEDHGFFVLRAETLEEMWNSLNSNVDEVGLIILDVMMPVGQMVPLRDTKGGLYTGFVVAKELRLHAKYKEIPVIIFTIMEIPEIFDIDPGIRVIRKQYTLPHELSNLVKEAISTSW